ncbi:probable CYB2 - lactate dehydrogenase cytochrome b2 [Cephalotrichum gorgonifer]|uniref:Probable CYB2 - lactate dehydrogenase cytochrome b2 n=1 Tax=Cephalotrichum gorgonifer TaxID=2041049 RepID=A0AAE8T065_9PEZI|nr:probable CYB2 - lactate dehydrogenase cytochrome b2 [Cephalotrichum gorgonifer]
MRFAPIVPATMAMGALAARPFLTSPDTGIDDVLGDTPEGTLPDLADIIGLHDFEWAARRYLPLENYTYYANGAAGEWSLRNNLEVFYRYNWRPRQMTDITGLPNTLNTTILGFNFSAPFYISPCARGVSAHKEGEINLVKGAAAGNILYIPSGYSSYTFQEIQAAKAEGQVVFQQMYLTGNITQDTEYIRNLEKAGTDALVLTIDSVAGSNRQRAQRFGVGSANTQFVRLTWEYYDQLREITKLSIAVKGVTSVDTAKKAVEHNVPAIVISNHGGRNLDGSPSALEILLDIHAEAPELLDQIEIWADGGVRYGGDVLKLLALGARAVGIGRPYMYANAYGVEGIEKVTKILKQELITDGGNIGLERLGDVDKTYVNWTPNQWLA